MRSLILASTIVLIAGPALAEGVTVKCLRHWNPAKAKKWVLLQFPRAPMVFLSKQI